MAGYVEQVAGQHGNGQTARAGMKSGRLIHLSSISRRSMICGERAPFWKGKPDVWDLWVLWKTGDIDHGHDRR